VTARLDAVLSRHLDLARDLGYAHRRLDAESSAWFVLERAADHVASLDAMTFPSAAELQAEFFAVCGDHDLAVEEALRVVDERARLVRRLLRQEAKR
jgi:hypothetical protein